MPEPVPIEPKREPRWAGPVVFASIAVLTVATVLALLYPRARAAIAAGVIISPIPPVP